MPGLSQLKQFNNDIQSLGDEVTLRASRGEKPVKVSIPKSIEDRDDTEDFVLGMPEVAAAVEDTAVDDDLSEITGISPKDTKKDSDAAPTFEAPDLSSILQPVIQNNVSADEGMPDFSQFMDEVQPSEPEEEQLPPEPEEVSVADMGLDALISSAGFDGVEGVEESSLNDDDDLQPTEEVIEEPKEVPQPKPEPKRIVPDNTGAPLDLEALGFGDEIASAPEPAQDFALDNADMGLDSPGSFDLPDESNFANDNLEPIEDMPQDNGNPFDDLSSPGDFDLPDESSFANDSLEPMEDISQPTDSSMDSFNAPDDFSLPEEPQEEFASQGGLESIDESGEEQPDSTANESADFGMDSLGDLPDMDSSMDAPSFDVNADFSDSDFGSNDNSDDSDGLGAIGSAAASLRNSNMMDSATSDIPEYNDEDNASDSFGDFGDSEGETDNFEQEGPIETFDTTGMDEDIDFGIQDTDSQLQDSSLGASDDFDLGNTDFEIPGFSDVETVKEEKKKKGTTSTSKQSADLDVPDFSNAKEGEELPPNTLSDHDYKTFLKNFSNYPLNVRLAFENLIVQDEFTDDAEFEVIEKIIHKSPARQVAGTLEKMLDISIPVPRDFEHRTADEYEAYKKSLSYQIRNKIIPGVFIALVALIACFGLYKFGKYCVVNPIVASSLYKKGYASLEAEEYPQSEELFNQAVNYDKQKKWFFKYARGYRDKKQYIRAEKMYKNILYCFKQDKQAGLEYVDMELYDLANYEKAEEVVRREILDYHIQDKDGILKLGDVFLEWGTEKDPDKLELAKEQYYQLIQLYGEDVIYTSRLMRYYIRTDNFPYVLSFQKKFEQKPKTISAEDWTELSGYLLDKMYGPLPPSLEPLRAQIEGLRKMLQRSVQMDKENPIALYNLGRYYVRTNEIDYVNATFKEAIDKFNKAPSIKRRDIYKFIDSYRYLGENFTKTKDYLQAQEQYTNGISLYTKEKESAGFEGNENVGNLYSDLADINYFVAADYQNAEQNYKNAISLGYDNPMIRYRLGYIQYTNKDYLSALGSFMKSGEENKKERNLLLAMANTLALRNDDYPAEGYYGQLIAELNEEILKNSGGIFPQTDSTSYDLVTAYLYATNNYGVTLYRLAQRTGDSSKNAQAIVQLQESLRAWDSLTRDQKTLVRIGGSNLAEENIKYITHPISEFEPSIYIEIPKTLTDKEKL